VAGKKSRDKGNRSELEIAKLLGARKISGFRRPGPDLVMPDGRFVESKVKADGFKLLYRWLDDDASILALRADRKGWLIVQRLEDWLDHEEVSDED
jgi:hypothetical protein